MAEEQTQIQRTRPVDNAKASILAEMAQLGGGEAPATEGDAAEATAPAAPAEEPADAGDSDETASTDETDEDIELDEAADDADDDDELEEAKDPDTRRRLSVVQRAERRSREALAAAQQAFETDRSRWRDEQRAVTDKASRLDSIAARFATDPVGVALELGIPDDHYEYIAEQLFRLSKKAQEDPRHREAARIARLEREIAETKRSTAAEKEQVEKERQATEAQEQGKRDAFAYLDRVGKAAPKEGLTARLLKSDPEATRARLARVASHLMTKTGGKTPAPAAVVKEFEKRRRNEYKAAGFDVDTVLGMKTPPAAPVMTANGKAATKKPAATSEKEPAKSKGDDRESILADLKAQRAAATE